ncbi:hypothetical protein [Alteromonas sp. MB-3u-76]|uniref:hypothetical protein n=1 Tax=Alteromonas sp. MB-3u-76 TaxID=2058133 RepID=UPI001E4FF1AE|nr:hypothetical protein [Alteromonas sp. MB-3u-76]
MSATKFRFTEQAIEKLSGSDKRARYYDAQMPGLIIDVLSAGKKTFGYTGSFLAHRSHCRSLSSLFHPFP